jgi:NAD(P)-dependent dehydrogenase (short-subunit alcohol dehydrogenase family)
MPGPALSGRSAVVTGGGRGIGAAVARALAAEGAAVVVAARTQGEIEQVASDLRKGGARAWAVACDVADERSVRAMAEEARARLGKVEVLVNDAGGAASAPLARIALRDWEEMLAVNATGTFLCTRELVPGMVERRWGRVVNVASLAGLEGAKYVSHYSAAKHAVVGFTRSVARELQGTGVTVNAVCPGYVDSPMTERTLENVRARTGLGKEQALAAVLATTGQERLLATSEVADAVLGLLREDAADVTGQAIALGRERALEVVNPQTLGAPSGWSHGMLAPPGSRTLFVAGQAGWDASTPGDPPPFAEQFARALDKVLTVVRAAGGRPSDLARLAVYVTDLEAYRASRKLLGEAWRARLGKHYPAMALVEVKGLLDRGALVEIEGTAIIAGMP